MRAARLGDVIASMKNGIYKPASEYSDDGVPCLRMYNIEAGAIAWRDVKRMRLTSQEQEDYGLREGDLLVNRVNSRELVGKSAYIPASIEPSVFESKNIRVRLARDRAEPKFINYQLLARGSRHFANNAQQVVGMASISQGQLADFPIVLAQIEEQRRVVAEIEKQFSRLDEAVANLQRVKANLKRYQSSVLAEAFAGSLVPLESTLPSATHKPFESGSDLVMRIARLRGVEASHQTGQAMPQGWAWSCLGDCFEVVVGATPSRKEAAYWGGGIPWVSSGEVQFGRIRGTQESISDLGLRNSSTKVNPAGSVLLGMIGQGRTRGQAAILDVEAANNQNCAAIWVSLTPIPAEFVFYWLMHRYQETRGEGSGNNQQALNKKLVQAIPIPVPPLAEQQRIVAEIDRRLSIVRGVEAEVDANLKRAQALRQAVLSRALNPSVPLAI